MVAPSGLQTSATPQPLVMRTTMLIQSRQELLAHKLQDAGTQASQAIQQMSQQVEDDQLRQLLDRRMQQGQQILQDVQAAQQRLGGQAQGGENVAAQGLIQEA